MKKVMASITISDEQLKDAKGKMRKFDLYANAKMEAFKGFIDHQRKQIRRGKSVDDVWRVGWEINHDPTSCQMIVTYFEYYKGT